jgi:predicted nuclease of predicted toxin-antitoxin system
MKLLFDENLPPALVEAVQSRFAGSAHVHPCQLGSTDDSVVWEFARAKGFTIVTKDSDFEQRAVLLGAPPKIIWLRTGNCTTAFLVALLNDHAAQIEEFCANSTDTVLELA